MSEQTDNPDRTEVEADSSTVAKAEPRMTDVELENLDYKLTRLVPGKSSCIKAGEWAYLASDGSLHKLTNDGYYSPWQQDMWTSCCWFWDEKPRHASIKPYGWSLGPIGYGKGHLITVIEGKIKDARDRGRRGAFPEWKRGFGRTHEASLEQEVNA